MQFRAGRRAVRLTILQKIRGADLSPAPRCSKLPPQPDIQRTPQPHAPMKIPRSHYLPRTRNGRIAAVAFLVAMALAQPPVVHGLMNRTEPLVLGTPFLFAYLLVVYSLGIAVLVWALRKEV